MKCSDFIAQFLKEKGISHVFDYTGGMIVNLEDSISRLEGIDCVPVRHEQAAGFAAEGYARAGKNFGVAIATSGPGATNMITSMGSCYFDSVPVLYITGQVNSNDLKKNSRIRQNGFQELDIVEVVKTITKYAKQVLDPKEVLYELEKSLLLMKEGRPGPVLLDLPFNVQTADIDPDGLRSFFDSSEHREFLERSQNITTSELDLVTLLQRAKSPVILCGNGIKISGTGNDLLRFSERSNLPVVTSLLGLGNLYDNHKNYVGFIGTYGNRAANIILANSDLVLVLGSRLDLRQTGNQTLFDNGKKIIHVDVDEYSMKDNFKDYSFMRLDLRSFFTKYSGMTVPAKEGWHGFVDRVKAEFREDREFAAGKYCTPNVFYEKFSSEAPETSVVIADVGQNQMWLAQSWQVKKGQELLFSGGMGAMGFSLPASIGAFFSGKTRPVYAFMGDGGFQMNIQELETIKLNKLPIRIIVLNNGSLGMVREFQDEYFNKNYQSTVIGYSCPDIEKIADAYGIRYLRLSSDDEIGNASIELASSQEPVILEVLLHGKTSLRPKVVYGESIENQIPFLSDVKRAMLSKLKEDLL